MLKNCRLKSCKGSHAKLIKDKYPSCFVREFFSNFEASHERARGDECTTDLHKHAGFVWLRRRERQGQEIRRNSVLYRKATTRKSRQQLSFQIKQTAGWIAQVC